MSEAHLITIEQFLRYFSLNLQAGQTDKVMFKIFSFCTLLHPEPACCFNRDLYKVSLNQSLYFGLSEVSVELLRELHTSLIISITSCWRPQDR